MRKCVAIAFVAVAAIVMNLSLASAAKEPQQKSTQAKQAEQQPVQSKTAAKDSNYRFHNGQWFYWMPQTKSWKVWNGQKWHDFQSSQTRTFSYEDPADTQLDSGFGGTYSTFGSSNSGYPYTNNRIIGSFGFRGAGSKAEGRY